MKTILICKDCSDQFRSSEALSEIELNTNVIFTKCMGVCPENKISVIELDKKKVNSLVSTALSLAEIKETLKKRQ